MASVIAAVKAVRRHLARIRYRLLLVNVLVAAVPLIGISFARMHEEQLLSGLEQDMIHQAQLVRALILSEDPSLPLVAREPALRAAAHDTRTRIRIVDVHGGVIADSHRGGPPEGAERPVPYLIRGQSPTHVPEAPKPVPILQRPEIVTALAGHYGAATRLWSNQDRVYLFVALPIMRDSQHVDAVVYVTRSTRDVKLQLYRLRTWLGRVLLGTLALTALLSLLLATTIARPLGKLTRRAQRIAARQPADIDRRLAARADEIGQLARAVEAMTEELERRARDARTLAADISHEFKTPLAGIRGAAELLRDGGASDDPDARERFLGMILDDAARLDRLVSRLLELARVEDDHSTALPVDLATIAQTCAERTWPVPVTVDAPPESLATGRSAQLASAIENLVANATQHADADTSVTIAIARRAKAWRITVTNHGPAISPAAQKKVWDRFYSTRSAAGGSGLGLAIVRSVALGHNGAVGLDCSDGVTAFWFEIA
jgi:two-component system, OmpR family, sensor histidine kinase ChvG